jgi:hypothetical protein
MLERFIQDSEEQSLELHLKLKLQEDRIKELEEQILHEKKIAEIQIKESEEKFEEKLKLLSEEFYRKEVTFKEAANESKMEAQQNENTLKKQIEDEETKNLCIICMSAPRDTVVMPCMYNLYLMTNCNRHALPLLYEIFFFC